MYPELIRIGHFSISTYGVLVGLAFLAAAAVARRSLEEKRLPGEEAWNLLVYAVLGGLAGGKIYYAVLHGDPSSLLSRSGLVWYGGLIGGAIAVFWGIRRKRLPLGPTADALAVALPLGHAIGHIGCFFSGDSYGLPSSLPWAVSFPRGAPPSTAGFLRAEFGVELPAAIPDAALIRVHPTMLYSAAALLLIFALLWHLRRRPRPAGWLFGIYLVSSGIERFLVEFVRAKDDRFLGGLTTAQAIAAVAIVGGLALVFHVTRRSASTVPILGAAARRGAGDGSRSPAEGMDR
ncbi:MAG: hypothetical protein GWN32_05895 [Gemmatimonadetes bacterium]|nr:hypothetical protein [Gemmatimonadota bacterium]